MTSATGRCTRPSRSPFPPECDTSPDNCTTPSASVYVPVPLNDDESLLAPLDWPVPLTETHTTAAIAPTLDHVPLESDSPPASDDPPTCQSPSSGSLPEALYWPLPS